MLFPRGSCLALAPRSFPGDSRAPVGALLAAGPGTAGPGLRFPGSGLRSSRWLLHLQGCPGPKAGGLRQREGEAGNPPLASSTSIGTWRIPEGEKGGIPHRLAHHPCHPTPSHLIPFPAISCFSHISGPCFLGPSPPSICRPRQGRRPRSPKSPRAPQPRLGLVPGAVGAAFAPNLGMEMVFGREEASGGTRPAPGFALPPKFPSECGGCGTLGTRGSSGAMGGQWDRFGGPCTSPRAFGGAGCA